MNPAGAPDQWVNLLDSLVPDILSLIVSTWGTMPALAGDAREDPTTLELCRRLRGSRNSCNLPFQVHTQMVELDPSAGEDQGKMDIVFLLLVPSEDIYFCLECKRLNVINDSQLRPYTAEYVTHGMMRFIRGQYASKVPHGGMLGYVLDGQLDRAIQNVSGIIQRRYKELRMKRPGTLDRSSVLPDHSWLRETRHSRRTRSRKFLMHHIFAACATEK